VPESREPRSFIAAAEQAAAAGDYASAERLLRDAAGLQEADLGPLHPDLANTLNNLGVVCEIRHKPADAEICYRRACAIATAVLAADHPFAVTSRKNLTDFCESREAPRVRPSAARLLPIAFDGFSRSFTIILLSLSGLVLMMFIATSPWLRTDRQADSSPVSPTSSPSESSPNMREPTDPNAEPKTATTNNRGPLAAPRGETRAASAQAPTLASARLCRGLSTGGTRGLAREWRCNPANRPVGSGALFFYTRLRSPSDTRVQHRWYRGDRLYQTVDLRIRANQFSGFRTYSRYTMDSGSSGDWRVELRSRDGRLLHEERFVVR